MAQSPKPTQRLEPLNPQQKAFAERRRTFLEAEFPAVATAMRQAGTLEDHLRETGIAAEQAAVTAWSQMIQQPAPERETPADRIRRFERIPAVAEELALTEHVLRVP